METGSFMSTEKPLSIQNVESLKTFYQVGILDGLDTILKIYNDPEIKDKAKGIGSYLDLFIDYLAVFGISSKDFTYKQIRLLKTTLIYDGLYEKSAFSCHDTVNGVVPDVRSNFNDFKKHQERVKTLRKAIKATKLV